MNVALFFRFQFQLLFLLLLGQNKTYAFELASGLTPPRQQKISLSYSGLFAEKADFSKETATTDFQSMDFSTPIYRTDLDSVNLKLRAEQLSIKPPQGRYSELYDLNFSIGYTKVIDENRLWSVSARYGSASDKPFADASVSTLGMTAFYSFPSDEKNRWLLLLDYSNNRPILNNLPLPGFAYFYQPLKEFKAVFGAPFASLNWQYSEKWALEIFTLVPWIFKSSISYKLNEYARVYTGLDFSQVTYYLHDRTNTKDRLFYDQKKLFVGIKSPLAPTILAEFELGHSFDRSLFIAENYTANPINPIDIGNAYYGKLSLKFFY